jgi:hypothetical protein
MIKNLTFGGRYSDEIIIMEAMLVSPAKNGYSNNTLIFEVHIITKGRTTDLSEWNFYIMDNQHKIHNAADVTELPKDGISAISALVAYDFRVEYLYNDIRLGFYYEPHNGIYFVEINH